jgi:Helicase conserved C-terminal domain
MSGRRRFDAEPVLATLKGFQRATVEHVTRRLYGPNPTRRFLVADETGLGKSLVARGVIARTIEQLQDDDSVDRIDIVYVCSNADIAQQNISRLDVTGDPHLPFASRLTLLAKHSQQFSLGGGRLLKPVNLVSFTPGTSFDMGWQTGKAEERAMLYLLLEGLLDLAGSRATAARRLLQGQVGTIDRFTDIVDQLDHNLTGDIDPQIVRGFAAAVRRHGMLRQFDNLVEQMGRKQSVPGALRDEVRTLTGRMRSELARVSVRTLEPDLVILDEFQRFRHLLDERTEAGELAHHLFNYGDAKVLLLSATPYKPFTYAEEAAAGDDHHRDFLRTLGFLANGCPQVSVDHIADELAAYRQAAITGAPVQRLADTLRHQLLAVMCRSERPEIDGGGMLTEHLTPAAPLDDDLLGYVALRNVARAVDGQLTIDYWKSAPYFVNFMDGYQLADKVRTAVNDPDRRDDLLPLLRCTQRLDRQALRRYEPIDFGNARLRNLAADTVDAGWWRLLWIPPSLPYFLPDGPYAEPFAATVTKRLVFSSWAATPTAVAALLSYDVERRIAEGSRLAENTPAARRSIANRLAYNLDGGRPQAMTTLALFWPMPGLAALADPLAHARRAADPPTAADVERAVAAEFRPQLPTVSPSRAAGTEAWYWAAALRRPDSLPADLAAAEEHAAERVLGGLSGAVPNDDETSDDPAGIVAHVNLALQLRRDGLDLAAPPPHLAETLAAIALHSPANIAWRALGRLVHGQPDVTPAGHWFAAAILAAGLRTLFARLETTLLLDRLLPDEVYWRAVLRYNAWGNLQAVLDEYLHHLAVSEGTTTLGDDRLADLAVAAASAIALRPSRYEAFNPTEPDKPLALTARFALRYGGRRQNEESSRQPEIRTAFNSPFWPFVLATTSVGQEGLDFHWWSHAVVHWNTPPNPVDFEQREGRVHRYGGHAVRRNIAQRHRTEILAAGDANPWRAAYQVATDETVRLGEFAPHWVYPGPARIQRHVFPYPLSVDTTKLERLKDDVALYRLTFGQPRQEDLLELLRHRGVQHDPGRIDDLRLDLRPPGSTIGNAQLRGLDATSSVSTGIPSPDKPQHGPNRRRSP